ncbi:WRKY transcription factor 55 [Tanacetum coccineum]
MTMAARAATALEVVVVQSLKWLRRFPGNANLFAFKNKIGYIQLLGGFEAMCQGLGGGNVELKMKQNRRTIRVMPCSQNGVLVNTEVPTEDGYTWRKYGQKEILGSKFPRLGALLLMYPSIMLDLQHVREKQVQRLDNDPYTFEVTYRGDHTCTLSSTAPSMPLPPPPPPPPPSDTASHSLPQWLSMEINRQSHEDLFSVTRHSMHTYQNQPNISTGAGPSSPTRYGDYQGVTDLVDTMFNSGSSSNNSMELIFSPNEEKKDGEEKTK